MTQVSGWEGLSCGIPLLQLMSNSATFWPYSFPLLTLGQLPTFLFSNFLISFLSQLQLSVLASLGGGM